MLTTLNDKNDVIAVYYYSDPFSTGSIYYLYKMTFHLKFIFVTLSYYIILCNKSNNPKVVSCVGNCARYGIIFA